MADDFVTDFITQKEGPKITTYVHKVLEGVNTTMKKTFTDLEPVAFKKKQVVTDTTKYSILAKNNEFNLIKITIFVKGDVPVLTKAEYAKMGRQKEKSVKQN